MVFRKVVRTADGAIDDAQSERATEELLERINASGRVFLSHTRLRDIYGIRVAIGHGSAEWSHVEEIVKML